MKFHFRFAITVGLVAVIGNGQSNAQELEQLRKGVRQASGPSPTKADRPRNENRQREWSEEKEADDDDSDFTALVGWGALLIVAAPFCLPRSFIDDDSFASGRFSRYPNRDGSPGLMRVDGEDCDSPDALIATESYDWLVRMRTEYTESFDDLSRSGGQLLLDTSSRWGIDSQFENLRESRDLQADKTQRTRCRYSIVASRSLTILLGRSITLIYVFSTRKSCSATWIWRRSTMRAN